MAEFKLADLLHEIDKHLKEGTIAGTKMAILESHKVLEAVLAAKGYPGKTIEKRLYWAGFSLKGKDDFIAALAKEKEIEEKIEVSISDFEASEIVESYKRVIKIIADRNKLNIADQLRNFVEMYCSPQSLVFWRNLSIFLGFFLLVRLLSGTAVGADFVAGIVGWAEVIISWQFFVIVAVVVAMIYMVQNYFAGKSKVKIKDEIKIKEYQD